ncbi:MAG: DUF1302 family protein [Sterolibacterium sp.]
MIKKLAGISALATLSALGTGAQAADWSLSGFVRQEMAVNTNNDGNMNNQQSNIWNGVPVNSTGLGAAFVPTLTRPASKIQDNTFNQFTTRLEVNLDGKLTESLSAHFKLRGIYDGINDVEGAFRGQNSYVQQYQSGKGTPLEVTRKNGMIDLPNAYLDYNNGPLWVRVGNQQIAWGEALFFRVSDVVNGLDLRRHLVLGVASEEYSDTRVPGLGIRGSFRVNENWDVEGFAQKFQPSILPGPNSPYNLIPSQFTVDEWAGYQEVKNKMNFGFRTRGKIGDYGLQAFAVRRYNPDGVYRWTRAQGPGAIPGSTLEFGTGDGVYSGAEWMNTAAHARLDGLSTQHINDPRFQPGATAAGANFVANACGANNAGIGTVSFNLAQANCLYDTFFSPPSVGGAGDLKGWLERMYKAENVFGFGVNHIFEGAPDTLMDQLIGRFEMSYTPNRKFTAIDLRQDFLTHNEAIFAFIFEKYHKFSSDFPATYFVAQWMHRQRSDIFGRALEGVNNAPGTHPKGEKGGSDYAALVLQQPSPTLEWRFDMAALTDFHGGWLFQPGMKWKPNKEMQVDFYLNIMKSFGEQNNKNFVQGLEYTNEAFVRATYAF